MLGTACAGLLIAAPVALFLAQGGSTVGSSRDPEGVFTGDRNTGVGGGGTGAPAAAPVAGAPAGGAAPGGATGAGTGGSTGTGTWTGSGTAPAAGAQQAPADGGTSPAGTPSGGTTPGTSPGGTQPSPEDCLCEVLDPVSPGRWAACSASERRSRHRTARIGSSP